jgi:hypothetical protein
MKSEIEQHSETFVVEGDGSPIDSEGEGLERDQGAAVRLTPARRDPDLNLSL